MQFGSCEGMGLIALERVALTGVIFLKATPQLGNDSSLAPKSRSPTAEPERSNLSTDWGQLHYVITQKQTAPKAVQVVIYFPV